MKKLILILFLLPVLCMGQTIFGGATKDTLIKSQTKVYNLGSYAGPVALYAWWDIDKVTGNPDYFVYLEHSATGKVWYPIASDTIDPVTDTIVFQQEDFWFSDLYRIRLVTDTSTQKISFSGKYYVRPRY